ncbi:RrF2 family transcriptional regulator [Phytoactinopolyspora limicola]|uniref:RrF2 family transcriptional regulator n=1 Tax=Phytoactinopolyspora limicola TaxID=2715536 RepID=UPI00140D6068|nr:Rrf2 family transcriptional regulator [Phytoactinopolyspora limicola]
MRLSSGVEWGLHCCVTLSQSQHPVPASRLAELHGVPQPYLAKQLQALSRANLVASTQGQAGGYELTRPASQITALDVVVAIDGTEPAFRCTEIRQRGPLAADPERCLLPCAIARAMATAEQAWRSALAEITVADLAEQVDADSGGTALERLQRWFSATTPSPASPSGPRGSR